MTNNVIKNVYTAALFATLTAIVILTVFNVSLLSSLIIWLVIFLLYCFML